METQLENKPLNTSQWKFAVTIQSLWQTVTAPHASIQRKDEQRQARLLSTMLFVVVVLGALLLVSTVVMHPGAIDDLDFQLYVMGVVILGAAYLLSRTERYQIASLIFITTLFSTFVFVPFFEGAQNQLLAFTVLATLLTGLFFPLKWVIFISIIEMVLITIQIQVTSHIEKFDYTVMLQFIILTDAMIVTFIHHLNAVERERRAELEDANAKLRESEASLERRVQARTRDLTVASDVSRRTTTVLNIDSLLPQLSTLTQQGFDLYGVSIYLHDPATGMLRLAAEANADNHMSGDNTTTLVHIDDQLGLISQAARTREAIVIGDSTQTTTFRANPVLPDTRSEMVVPMLVGKQLVGMLDLQSKQVNRFSEEDTYIITTLAEQMAIAVRNAQLFQEAETARQAAETANETKSRFLANMSHELRTPLNAILNFTAFVADGVLGDVNEEQVEVLQESIASGKHLLSLINDVLDITKIEAGMMELFIEQVDIHAELTAAVSVGKGLIKEKPVKLLTDIDDDLPSTYGDKRRLRQVFLNLISNAAKFTAAGEITITAKHWENGIEVIVKDTGMGIAPSEHHKVFESFRQAKHDLAGTVGTGLGMPITKYFVEMHSGQIWFESQPGEGTTFYARLPQLSQSDAEKINELAQAGQ